MVALRICQLRAQGLENLSYEERTELWNLENEQYAELHRRYFERAPVQTEGCLGWTNIWHRLQEDDAASLQLLRISLSCFTTLHNKVQRDVGLRFGRNQETVQRKFIEVLTVTENL
ncbi:unnamed protein product, partial [Thlaspi arvense]